MAGNTLYKSPHYWEIKKELDYEQRRAQGTTVPQVLDYLKRKLPGKTTGDFKRLAKFMMEKTILSSDQYKIYNDLGNGYMGLLIRFKSHKTGNPYKPYILLFKGEPLELIGDKEFENNSIESTRATYSFNTTWRAEEKYPWMLSPLDVISEVANKRNKEYQDWEDEEKVKAAARKVEEERKAEEERLEQERRQKEVHVQGNIEYNILSTSSNGSHSSIYGSDSMTIRVINGATKEDVFKQFKDPLTSISNNGDNIYHITWYRD